MGVSIEIAKEKDKAILTTLQYSLRGQGRFFTTQNGKKMFALEGINLADGSLIGQQIQTICTTKRLL